MATKRIEELPTASVISETDYIAIDQPALTVKADVAAIKSLISASIQTDIYNNLYPVGEILITRRSGSPDTWLNFGTWERYSEGQTLVGYDSDDGNFNTLDGTGGSKTHTLTINEIPSHNHTHNAPVLKIVDGLDSSSYYKDPTDAAEVGSSETTSSTGGGQSHNNLQPYIVVYMWKRIG